MIYFDNAATTMVCKEAAEKALYIMTDCFGNPSSTHSHGRRAKKELDEAREKIANALGCNEGEVYFTSGGTESDHWAITKSSKLIARNGRHIITSLAEHSAVSRAIDSLEQEGFEVSRLKPDETGAISAQSFESALREDTCFASLMLVNNETGAISDIKSMARLLKRNNPNALFHCDAVQAFTKIPFSVKELGADLLSISGHKIHAPKGVGALYISGGVKLGAMLSGGGQEKNLRSGTEGLSQIAAFGSAAEIAFKGLSENNALMMNIKNHIIKRLSAEIPEFRPIETAAPHILNLSIIGYKSEILMNLLEMDGIFISKSSACKKGGRSHVLESMGLNAVTIDGSIRISFSRFSSLEEADIFCDKLKAAKKSVLPVLR
ncbi:cysteine desulfurase [Clostridiaceae bacterium OttesenSCG-928-D20]|nr:cysteine desulfurase [Clostridiaceae bacterium OttesenSCG-928-D20]